MNLLLVAVYILFQQSVKILIIEQERSIHSISNPMRLLIYLLRSKGLHTVFFNSFVCHLGKIPFTSS
jgi:hypothetical protein